MTNNKVLEKLSRFVSKELTNSVGDLAIFKNNDGSFLLFNEYLISRGKDNSFVIAIDTDTVSLSCLKHAVTWCIYNKRHKTSESHRIVELDRALESIDVAIIIHKKLIKNSKNLDDKLIHLAKLSQEQVKKRYIEYELSIYMMESKKWQENKFNQKR